MLRTITPKEGTPTAVIRNRDSSGKKVNINGVDVWLKGCSCTFSDSAKSPYNDFNLVPTTVLVLFEGKLASAQQFITAEKPSHYPPPLLQLFDYIIGNSDRHGGNWLVEGEKIWAIDNAYSFDRNRYNQYYDQPKPSINGIENKPKLKHRIKLILSKPSDIHKLLDCLIGDEETNCLISRLREVLKALEGEE
jgi:hypothetical protein